MLKQPAKMIYDLRQHKSLRKAYLKQQIRNSQFPTRELSELFSEPQQKIESLRREYSELQLSTELKDKVTKKRRETKWNGGGQIGEEIELLYIVTRLLEPDRIIETGVSAGYSTAFILTALKKNGHGQLRSIDLPVYQSDTDPYDEFGSYLPDGEKSGWAIPDGLRDQWELYEGKSSEHLNSILKDWRSIDVFFHDSGHTYHTMRWEYDTAWPHIRPGGVLASDDIYLPRLRDLGDPFGDFAKRENISPITYSEMGILPVSDSGRLRTQKRRAMRRLRDY